MTQAEIKDFNDTAIRVKTADNSISTDNVADALDNLADVSGRFGVTGEDDTASASRAFAFAAHQLAVTGTAGSGSSPVKITQTGVGNALQLVSGSGPALNITGTGAGIVVANTNGAGLNVSGSTSVSIIANTNAAVDTTVTALSVQRKTAGTAADGIGTQIELAAQNTDGTARACATIVGKWVNATAATRLGELSFQLTNAVGGNRTVLAMSGRDSDIRLVAGLDNYANDAAAAVGGIAVNGLYRNGSVVMIRVS